MDRRRRTGSTIPTPSESELVRTSPTRTGRRTLFGLLQLCAVLFVGSCTFVPTFSTPLPPLLLHQKPETPPLFVLHPPKNTKGVLFFTGHAHKEKSPETARKKALAQALKKLGATLSRSGYTLSPEEGRRWLRERPLEGPQIADSWMRTYIQSSERPYIHLTSLYVLLSVPVSYVQRITQNLARQDRIMEKALTRQLGRGETDLARGEGAQALRNIRLALETARRIHSLTSFPADDRGRVDRERQRAAHLWRSLLRGLDLSLVPARPPLVLREFPVPPAALNEGVRTRIGSRRAGISGLVFVGKIFPREKSEHLVLPPLPGIVADPKTPFAPSTLFWETFLLRQPPYRAHHRLSLACSPTGSDGTGVCLIRHSRVPRSRGILEGHYRPAAGTPLDRPFFDDLLAKTLIDIHFRFYHRRALAPLLLLLPNRSESRITLVAEKGLIDPLGEAGITLCLRKGRSLSCPTAPRGLPLPTPKAQLLVSSLQIEPKWRHHADFSVATIHLRMSVTLTDAKGVFLVLPLDSTGRGFDESSAFDQAFREAGQRLARLLPLSYLPDRHPHPGAAFYDP